VVHKVRSCSTLEVMASVSTEKLKALDVAIKFEIEACENGNVRKTKIGRCYNFKFVDTLQDPKNRILYNRNRYIVTVSTILLLKKVLQCKE
jgi:hypothetical protein